MCTNWDQVAADVSARLALSVTTPRTLPEEEEEDGVGMGMGSAGGAGLRDEEMPLLGQGDSSVTVTLQHPGARAPPYLSLAEDR